MPALSPVTVSPVGGICPIIGGIIPIIGNPPASGFAAACALAALTFAMVGGWAMEGALA